MDIKGLDKERFLTMINTLFPKESDVILASDIQNKIDVYGDDYFICDGKWELAKKNINWQET